MLPALGTHKAMSAAQLERMYPALPRNRIRVHDWRSDVVTVGEVPAAEITAFIASPDPSPK